MDASRRTLLGSLLGALAIGSAAARTPPAVADDRSQIFLFLFRPGPAWRQGVPMARQDLRAHAAYHARLVSEGRGFAGGGYVGEDGGLAIVRAASRAAAQAMLEVDPAIVNGVFVAELRQWAPRFHTQAPLIPPPR